MTTSPNLDLKWVDAGKAVRGGPPDYPTGVSNPAFPNGRAIDASMGFAKTCVADLAYPFPNLGSYDVTCSECGLTFQVFVRAFADDPHTIKVACLNQAGMEDVARAVAAAGKRKT